jgi:hypothetical protein
MTILKKNLSSFLLLISALSFILIRFFEAVIGAAFELLGVLISILRNVP